MHHLGVDFTPKKVYEIGSRTLGFGFHFIIHRIAPRSDDASERIAVLAEVEVPDFQQQVTEPTQDHGLKLGSHRLDLVLAEIATVVGTWASDFPAGKCCCLLRPRAHLDTSCVSVAGGQQQMSLRNLMTHNTLILSQFFPRFAFFWQQKRLF